MKHVKITRLITPQLPFHEVKFLLLKYRGWKKKKKSEEGFQRIQLAKSAKDRNTFQINSYIKK